MTKKERKRKEYFSTNTLCDKEWMLLKQSTRWPRDRWALFTKVVACWCPPIESQSLCNVLTFYQLPLVLDIDILDDNNENQTLSPLSQRSFIFSSFVLEILEVRSI